MSFLMTTCRQISSFLFKNSLSSRLLLNRTFFQPMLEPSQEMSTLHQMHRKKFKKIKPKKRPTFGVPFLRGIVLKTLIKKPKKPNSANRKCVRVRLSNGKEANAYVPGEGHNLQEHSIVLVRGGRLQDVPGVKLKCVRGKYDLAHVKKVAK